MRRSLSWATVLTATVLVTMSIVASCTRNHDNPLDPANDDPFNLRVEGLVGRIRLVWDIPNVPRLESTVIFRKDTVQDTLNFVELTRVAVPETSYTDWDVSTETRYVYKVASYARGDMSRYSLERDAMPRAVSPPFSVVVTDYANDQGTCLNISWAPSPMDTTGGEITGYEVMRDTVDTGTFAAIDTTQAQVTSFVDCGLTPNALYYYRVAALAGPVISPPSNTASGRALDNIAPGPPEEIEASDYPADQGTALTVSWSLSPDDGAGAGDVEQYEVFRAVEDDTTAVYRVGSASAGDTLFLDQDVEPGDIFYYWVRAKDSRNNSAFSVSDSAIAVDNGAPGSPSGLDALNPSPDGGGKINLSWQLSPDDIATGDIEGYKVYRRTTEEEYGDPLILLPSGTADHTDSTVTDLMDYYYVVTAYDGALESTPSNEAGPVAADDEMPPSAVSDLAATPGEVEGEVVLTWTAPGDNGMSGTATTYYIKYAADSIATGSDWNNVAQSVPTWQIPVPAPGGSSEQITVTGMPTNWEAIWFSIRAEDDRFNLAWLSNSASTSAQQDVTPPGAIDDLFASNQGVIEGQIRLTWTATGDDGSVGTASRYQIKISTSQISPQNYDQVPDTLPDPPLPQPFGSDEEYLVMGLTPDVLYYFMLRVFDEVGNNALSNSHNERAQVDVTPPGAVIDLSATGDSEQLIEGQILLTWTAPGDDADSGDVVTSYEFRYATEQIVDETSWNNALDLETHIIDGPQMSEPGDGDSITADGFTTGQTYYFACKAEDDASLESDLSNSPGTTPQGDVTEPGQIVNLLATGNASDLVEGQIRLRWTAPGDDGYSGETVSGYVFKYSTQGFGFQSPDIWWQNATDLSPHIFEGPELSSPAEDDSLSAQELPSGELLYFACKAFDDAENESDVSNAASDTVQTDVTPPAAVTTLDASTGSSQGRLKVRWTAVADDSTFAESGPADSYDLRYSLDPITADNWNSATQVADLPVPSEPGQEDSVVISGLEYDVVYYVALKVLDSDDNESGLSNCDSAPSGADIYPPPDVSNFEAEAGDEIVQLTWVPPNSSDYEGVLIARRTGAEVTGAPYDGDTYTIGETLPPTWSSEVVYIGSGFAWDDTSVANDSTYHYRAFSYDLYWNYSEGVSVSATPEDAVPPSQISSLSASQYFGESPSDKGVRLLWQNPNDDDLEEVMIRYSTVTFPADTSDGELLVLQPAEPGAADSARHILGSEITDTYYYAAFAGDEVPNYADPATASVDYDGTPPAPVDALNAERIDVDSIELTWTNQMDPDRAGFILLRRMNDPVADFPMDGQEYTAGEQIGNSYVLAIITDPDEESFLDDQDRVGGNTYHYTIQTYDAVLNYSAAEAASEELPEP